MTSLNRAFRSITPTRVQKQHNYWQGVAPHTEDDRFRRWLFAFTSVHTTWENNVKGYIALRDLGWAKGQHNSDELLRRLIEARVGLHNVRARDIWAFKVQFYHAYSPDFFCKRAEETWPDYRHRVCDRIKGLGYAKTSFAIELLYPTQAEVVCLDVHMLRLYGFAELNGRSGTRFAQKYKELEADWIHRCKRKATPSYIARCVYWDRLQEKPDSRYWSHCLEEIC